jgi:hypothetical protein
MALVSKPLLELYEVARDRVLMTLANETYQSYPILVPAAGPDPSGRVVFLYGTLRSVPREGRYLMAPSLRAVFDATRGELLSRDAVLPADLGGSHAPGEVLGLHVLAQGMSADEYNRERARLFSSYDRLAERFFAGETKPAPEGTSGGFRDLFFSLAEKPLAPYYRSVGREFFTWVDASA